MTDANRVEISGRLVELEDLRHTPAGIPIVRFHIDHQSLQQEAGGMRKVECEVEVVAIEREARLVASAILGTKLVVRGFLDSKRRNGGRLTLHATQIEFKIQV